MDMSTPVFLDTLCTYIAKRFLTCLMSDLQPQAHASVCACHQMLPLLVMLTQQANGVGSFILPPAPHVLHCTLDSLGFQSCSVL